jgi:hypothetical protein
MLEPSPAWAKDNATAKAIMCGALKYNLSELAYWVGSSHSHLTPTSAPIPAPLACALLRVTPSLRDRSLWSGSAYEHPNTPPRRALAWLLTALAWLRTFPSFPIILVMPAAPCRPTWPTWTRRYGALQ